MKIIAHIIYSMVFFVLTIDIALGYPDSIDSNVIPETIQFQLIDPSGNKTGYDPATGVVENIPNTIYLLYQERAITGAKPDKYHSGYGVSPRSVSANNKIATGKYQLKIFGSNVAEQYLYDIRVFYSYDSTSLMLKTNPLSIIYPNAVWTYEFDVPATPSPDGKLVVTKVATPTDLIKDLTTAGQLGYIGNAKFVTELTKEINEIEAEKAKGKIDDGLTPAQKAKKEYTELLKEITEKYNKPESDEFVKQEAYTVLREDLEYIIGHMQ